MPGWPGPAPASSAIAAACSWPPSRQVWASRGPAAPVRYSRVLLAVEQSNSNLWACDQAKRLPPLDKRLGSWAGGSRTRTLLIWPRNASPSPGRRGEMSIGRALRGRPAGSACTTNSCIRAGLTGGGWIMHSSSPPRPGDGPCHVGGRRRGHDVGEGGGIAQRADLADQLVDLGAAFLQGAVEVDVLGEDPVSQRVIPIADQLFG